LTCCIAPAPAQVTHYAAVCLFLVFGARMLNESREASNAASDELEEVEAELSKKQATYTSVGTQDTQVRGQEGARTRRKGWRVERKGRLVRHPMGWYLVAWGAWWRGRGLRGRGARECGAASVAR
jgi:hypothetical protein